jgi:hypothetical protein
VSASKTPASASVIVAAVFAILAGLITLLMMSLGFFGILLGTTQDAVPELPAFVRSATLAFLAFLVCLSVFGIATGIGLILLRNWARISVLIWGGFSVFFGVLGIPIILFMSLPPPPDVPNLSPASMQMARLFLAFMYGIPLIVGLWWLILFNRKAVKAQFAGIAGALDQTVPQKPRCPVPVAVLAGLYITAAAHIVILPFLPFSMPLILFGHLFQGNIGTLFYALNCLVLAVVGVSLLKLKPWAYHLTMGLNLFWFASGIGTILHPNYFSQMASIIHRSQQFHAFATEFLFRPELLPADALFHVPCSLDARCHPWNTLLLSQAFPRSRFSRILRISF